MYVDFFVTFCLDLEELQISCSSRFRSIHHKQSATMKMLHRCRSAKSLSVSGSSLDTPTPSELSFCVTQMVLF